MWKIDNRFITTHTPRRNGCDASSSSATSSPETTRNSPPNILKSYCDDCIVKKLRWAAAEKKKNGGFCLAIHVLYILFIVGTTHTIYATSSYPIERRFV